MRFVLCRSRPCRMSNYRYTEHDLQQLKARANEPRKRTRRLAVTEHEYQVRVFQWAELMKHKWPCLEFMYAVPNGESRPWMKVAKKDGTTLRISPVAKRLKAEGVKSGVPDIFLPAMRGGYGGCYVEMKAGENTTSENQDAFIAYLKRAGYMVGVSWSDADTIAFLTAYLNLEPRTDQAK